MPNTCCQFKEPDVLCPAKLQTKEREFQVLYGWFYHAGSHLSFVHLAIVGVRFFQVSFDVGVSDRHKSAAFALQNSMILLDVLVHAAVGKHTTHA